MTSAVRVVASSAAKTLMNQNVVLAALTSARNVATQAQVADRYEDSNQDSRQSSDTGSGVESYQMYVSNLGDTINVNLENVSNNMQKDIVEKLGLSLVNDTDMEKIRNVKFNSVTEEVYRHSLYMPFRKLGYECKFSRYNGDKGLALFKLDDTKRKVRRSVYRSGLPNIC